jgi:hypothetical protein
MGLKLGKDASYHTSSSSSSSSSSPGLTLLSSSRSHTASRALRLRVEATDDLGGLVVAAAGAGLSSSSYRRTRSARVKQG